MEMEKRLKVYQEKRGIQEGAGRSKKKAKQTQKKKKKERCKDKMSVSGKIGKQTETKLEKRE